MTPKAIAVLLILSVALPAAGHYQTLPVDITKNDKQAYTTNIPAEAFTPKGLKLDVKKGQQYVLTSNRFFDSEFDFDVRF